MISKIETVKADTVNIFDPDIYPTKGKLYLVEEASGISEKDEPVVYLVYVPKTWKSVVVLSLAERGELGKKNAEKELNALLGELPNLREEKSISEPEKVIVKDTGLSEEFFLRALAIASGNGKDYRESALLSPDVGVDI